MFKKKQDDSNIDGRLVDFQYLKSEDIYMDSACQSVRPQPVIDAITNYYSNYNACGGRVKYKWGQKVDSEVEEARELVIDYLGLPAKDYVCSFTLNTTYGMNLILSQLPVGVYSQIITSEIEHNSVFLPTMELSKRLDIKRKVLARDIDGNLIYDNEDLDKAIVVVNAASNIDGRLLGNIKQLINDTHKAGGIIIIDAAQAMAHYRELLSGCQADAFCFSAHKMYAASLGGIVIRKDLLNTLDIKFVGGGMVYSVHKEEYELLPDDLSSRLEPGLQAYGEIISLGAAIKWLKTVKPNGMKPADYINDISEKLYEGLSNIPGLKLINNKPSSVISVYSDSIDAHRLAIFLSASGIMTRSGHYCCHYYLSDKLNLPPLLRFSVGLHTSYADVEKVIATMAKLMKGAK